MAMDRQESMPHDKANSVTHIDAERWLAAIVESSDDAIIGKSLDGIITSWNSGAQRIFGYSADEVIGKPITILVPQNLWHEETKILGRLRSGERIEHFETTRIRKDGSTIAISLTISPIRDATGAITGVSKIARDVTEHKKLLAREAASHAAMLAERKFRELIENAPDPILQVDSMGLIVLANLTAELVFGYSRDELIGMSVDALVPDAARSRHPAHRKGFEAAGQSRPMGMGLDLRAVRKDGTEFPVEISLSPNRTEGGIHITAVIRDVTERKRAEQQIHSLEQSYTTELEARHKEAERLNQLKSEFIASVSHELRTPLHTIIGFAELLGEEGVGLLNEKQRRFVHHIQTDSEHLLGLINDVLDLSRIEAGGLVVRTETLSLQTAITEAVNAIRPQANGKQVEVREDRIPNTSVVADPLRVRQILYNLLSNGVKFTDPGGEVVVTATVDEDFVQITVADTGLGISSEECGRIFDKFYQVGYTTTGIRQGTGLGLTICKQLVEIQCGRIWVESEPGKGSRFHFTLPALPNVTRITELPDADR
jgi:PAS domain S-box-containing protein